MLVVKSCVELLRSCGINNLVAVSENSVLFGLQTTYHLKHRTCNNGGLSLDSGIQGNVCLSTDNRERITTWKEMFVL